MTNLVESLNQNHHKNKLHNRRPYRRQTKHALRGGYVVGFILLFFLSAFFLSGFVSQFALQSQIAANIHLVVGDVLSRYYSQNVHLDDNGLISLSIRTSELDDLKDDIEAAVKKVCQQKLYDGANAPSLCTIEEIRVVNFEELRDAGASASCDVQARFVTDYVPGEMAAVYKAGYNIPDGNRTKVFNTQWCAQYKNKFMLPYTLNNPITIMVVVRPGRLFAYQPDIPMVVYSYAGVHGATK